MTSETPKTKETGKGTSEADNDVQSDPGRGAEDRTDWAAEGGATSAGPATDTPEDENS
jgi:hypothetical protein